jgi:hypothetical protein
MLVRDMFFHEGSSFEKLLAGFTPELPLIFLFDEWFNSFC